MKESIKTALMSAIVASTVVVAGCSTVESIYTEIVPNTDDVVTTPLPDVVITEEVVPAVIVEEEAPVAE